MKNSFFVIIIFSFLFSGWQQTATAQTASRDRFDTNKIYSEGLRRLQEERFVEAARLFESAVIINPNDAAVRNALGTTYFHLKQYDSAFTSFSKAVELNPRFANAFYNLGNLLDQTGRADQSIIYYQ